jgi:hypothetical protein
VRAARGPAVAGVLAALGSTVALALVPAPAQASPAAAKRAPNTPPLATGVGVGAGALGGEEAAASSPPGGGEPLSRNGLASPLCSDAGEADLPASAARDCQATGFEAAEAPSGDYAFDVHIDTGVTHPLGDAEAIFQELAQFEWTSLVTVIHGLIVLLDWCFTLDLLNSRAMSGVGQALRATQATFTQPWLAVMLAIAALLALYHGLIRRRVAQTLGEALLMLAMMASGLWVIMDPTGTLGVLGAWANEASLGTLGAVTAGTPSHPQRTLAEADQLVFSAAIDGPWCYLEFGDVSWCENAGRLESKLRSAALGIARREQAQIGCQPELPEALANELGTPACVPKGSAQAAALQRSAQLLRDAKTNGELFLALPANGKARNSVNESWSLYRALCGGGEPCKGPAAAEAQARTQSETSTRIVGLAFISIGLLGMILAVGFIALRLLGSAIVGLICLLLTPAAVLAPALGESGRDAFRAWATRLLGAVVSKLVFSFLLGAVIESERALADVRIGWLTQWVLISAMWWIGFLNRHKVLGFGHGEHGGGQQRQSLAQRVHRAFDTPRTALRQAGGVRRKLARPAPSGEGLARLARAGHERAGALADAQVARGLERELEEAQALMRSESELRAGISERRARLARLQAERTGAQGRAQVARAARTAALADQTARSPLERDRVAAGLAARERLHRNRAARLADRASRLQAEITDDEGALGVARRAVREGERARRTTGSPYTREQVERRAQLLDAQAALPPTERDYAALMGLVGYGRGAYEALDGPGQRQARMRIDRELALRRELGGAATDMAADVGDAPGRRERRRADREVRRRVGERMRAEGHSPPSGLEGRRPSADRLISGAQGLAAWRGEGADARDAGARGGGSPSRSSPPRSPVLDDAREVAARRKRQLGYDQP